MDNKFNSTIAQTAKPARNSNLELLRIVSILLIITMHVVGYAASQADLSIENIYFRHFIGAIGNLGVGCFVLISGYYGVKFSWKKFVYICLLTTIYAILSNFCNDGFRCTRNLLMAVTWVPRYFNWYITCYLALMLTSGYINEFCNGISRKRFAKMLIILFVLLSIFPMLDNVSNVLVTTSGQCFTYFLYAYLIGRYIRLYKDIKVSRWLSSTIIIFMVFIMWLKGVGSIKIELLTMIPLISNNSPTIIIGVIAAFYWFKSLSIQSRLLNYISSSVLAAYLLDHMRPTIDRYLCVYSHAHNNDFVLWVFLEVFTIFVIAIIIDKIRIHLLYRPEAWLTNKFVSVCEKMNAAINNVI